MATKVKSTRNVVLVGHNGNGKTSLAEAMIYRAGLVGRLGRVDDGTTICDADPEEQARHQSLSSSTISFTWGDHHITLIDTPGYADFTGSPLQAMMAADLALFVIDGVSGVQAQDRLLWRHAAAAELPRMCFVNGLDRAHASYEKTLADLRSTFGSATEPVELPIGQGSAFHGIADLLTDEAFVYDSGHAERGEIPAALEQVEHASHEHLVEEVVENDDELLEKYLDGTTPGVEDLERLLHESVDSATVFPVLCGSATEPIGVDHLLDFICHVGPSPDDGGPTTIEAGDETMQVAVDPDGPPLAYVFQTRLDDFLGSVSYIKVLSGTIRTDDTAINTRTRQRQRLHQLLAIRGGNLEPTSQITAGSIAAIAKLDATHTGDTLAPEGLPGRVPAPRMPEAVHDIAVRAATPAHEDRLAVALRRLTTEDPSLRVSFVASTGQTLLSGGGETHIRVALSRLERAGVNVETEDAAVAYLETLTKAVTVESRHKKQTGGHGQFAVATVRFEPLARGAGFEFDSEVTGGTIPRNLIPAVGTGVEEAMAHGGILGFPVVDLRAVCTDGRTHSVDSSEMAFKMAGSLALRSAMKRVGTLVLEPVSDLIIEVPDESQGDILSDLSSRRAHVLGTGPGHTGGSTEVKALVPTSEIRNYAIDLRAMTGGTGAFSRSHHGYQTLPSALAARLGRDT